MGQQAHNAWSQRTVMDEVPRYIRQRAAAGTGTLGHRRHRNAL
jgi:hypothetical protein